MGSDLGPILIVAAITAIAGFVQNSMGFGYALTAMAVLPFWLDIRVASLVVSFSAVLPLVVGAIAYRRSASWPALRESLIAMALCLPVGILLFARMPTTWLVRGTGVVILLLSLEGLLMPQKPAPARTPPFWGGLAGGVSGFLSGLTGIGGPPLIAYAVRQPWSPAQLKGYLFPLLLIQSILRVGGLLGTGLIDQSVLLYSTVGIPFAYAGGHLGTVASREINPVRFRQLSLVMLAAIAVGMITSGG